MIFSKKNISEYDFLKKEHKKNFHTKKLRSFMVTFGSYMSKTFNKRTYAQERIYRFLPECEDIPGTGNFEENVRKPDF